MRLLATRRRLIGLGAAGTGSLLLPGCDRLSESPSVVGALEGAEDLNRWTQRAFGRKALAREYREADMSPVFRANGSRTVDDPAYRRHAAEGFANWSLRLDGLVERPLQVPLHGLRAMPQRPQITRHDCVEGWSAIGRWQGPRLSLLLDLARLRPEARYIVFHCADRYRGRSYYESIDLVDAFHPQTILAWALNGAPLDAAHGAPLRLRVERQLGYKHAKFVSRIEAVASLEGIHGGRGGYWEDTERYAWYAGI
ncbi:molybdopterin-dependent oxidoreductase [Novosphingobium soli]|uniref:Molybdopterin-dependent oxidoreductase n=1 Tax=Novosphingobium soli TaxID=574956 RepID=A0ABV6D0C7_9SPHN